MFSFQVLALLAWAFSASCQFLTAPTNLTNATGYAGIPVRYKQVPAGICEQDPSIKSYSGYADIAENEHIFWWFFETRNGDPSKAPLTVWINGGPGSSSMIGLFQENGPCRVDANGNAYNNPYSWSNASNMLFIDQPAQTGFSYSIPIPGYVTQDEGNVVVLSNGSCPSDQAGSCGTFSLPNVKYTANSTANAAPGFWKTLQGFFGAFPQYSRNGFHFTTESYGGHYASVFSEYIEEQNAKNAGHEIHLESVMIGNGWYDPLIQYAAYYNFTVFPGNTYDLKPFNSSIEKLMYDNMYGKGNCFDQISQCYSNGSNEICNLGDNYCANNVEALLDNIPNRDEYDMRELSPDPFPSLYYVPYLNTPKVQQAIGAFTNFTESSYAVYTAFNSTGDDGREDKTICDMQKLIKDNLTVVMYHGDADYNCNWLGGEVVSQEIWRDGMAAAGYANMTTSDGIVHAQVKQSENFAFVRVYYSGHEVPFYQPLASLELFERTINGVDIETGKVNVTAGSGYRTKGTAKSTFREGNTTVQYQVLPTNATYNTTTGAPNPINKAMQSRLQKRGSRWM